MSAPTLYALFPGTAREALTFYQRVFGGELQLYTFADFNRADGPADAIAHGQLTGEVTLYGADAAPDEDAVVMTGMMLSILGMDAPRLRGWFEALSDGGRVLDPLQRRPWGDFDGQVRDQYGLVWLIGFKDDGHQD